VDDADLLRRFGCGSATALFLMFIRKAKVVVADKGDYYVLVSPSSNRKPVSHAIALSLSSRDPAREYSHCVFCHMPGEPNEESHLGDRNQKSMHHICW
jgi:hypothetical protein